MVKGREGDQDMPSQNIAPWREVYFELKAFENQ